MHQKKHNSQWHLYHYWNQILDLQLGAAVKRLVKCLCKILKFDIIMDYKENIKDKTKE